MFSGAWKRLAGSPPEKSLSTSQMFTLRVLHDDTDIDALLDAVVVQPTEEPVHLAPASLDGPPCPAPDEPPCPALEPGTDEHWAQWNRAEGPDVSPIVPESALACEMEAQVWPSTVVRAHHGRRVRFAEVHSLLDEGSDFVARQSRHPRTT